MSGSNAETQPPTLSPQDVEGTYVVIAAYNEASCIEQVASEARTLYPHVVVVDDGSTDETYVAAGRSATYVLRHLVNRGQGLAEWITSRRWLDRSAHFAQVQFSAHTIRRDQSSEHGYLS